MKTKRIRSLLILSFIICHLSFSPAWAQGNPYGIYPVPHLTQVTDQTAAVTEAVCIIVGDGIDAYTKDRAIEVLEEL